MGSKSPLTYNPRIECEGCDSNVWTSTGMDLKSIGVGRAFLPSHAYRIHNLAVRYLKSGGMSRDQNILMLWTIHRTTKKKDCFFLSLPVRISWSGTYQTYLNAHSLMTTFSGSPTAQYSTPGLFSLSERCYYERLLREPGGGKSFYEREEWMSILVRYHAFSYLISNSWWSPFSWCFVHYPGIITCLWNVPWEESYF